MPFFGHLPIHKCEILNRVWYLKKVRGVSMPEFAFLLGGQYTGRGVSIIRNIQSISGIVECFSVSGCFLRVNMSEFGFSIGGSVSR